MLPHPVCERDPGTLNTSTAAVPRYCPPETNPGEAHLQLFQSHYLHYQFCTAVLKTIPVK